MNNDPNTNRFNINTAGGKVKASNSGKTKVANILSPKTIHTTIDNTLHNVITNIESTYLNLGEDTIAAAKKII